MGRVPPWEVLATEELQDCAVFSVSRVLSRSPRSGEPHPFYRIDAEPWVNVVPVTEDGQVVMVRQFRHGAGRVTLEIPGGIVDPGEEPAHAAGRELREETGFSARELRPIGVVNPNPALFGNRVHTYLASGAHRVGEIQNQGDEETVVELVPEAQLPELLRQGEIDHALVIAALHWWHLERAGSGAS